MTTTPLAELTVYLNHTSASHPLPPGSTLTIGRGSRVHIRIDEPSVSREHVLLHVGKNIEVEDLGSSNGTQIFQAGSGNSPASQRGIAQQSMLEPGRRYILESGDVLRIGTVPCLLKKEETTEHLRSATAPPPSESRALIADPEMRRIYELAYRAARSGIAVLIHGETGSGKELLAEAVHLASSRASQAFLKVNCGAISENLLESELFGHERGAFTGAATAHAGLFEAADKGTLFLDEIGEMSLSTQVKLLRVLEERTVRRVGSTKNIAVDVRFVAATNRDLSFEVASGRFREDLFYRLGGITITIPPLRERPSEIEPLARHFLSLFCIRSRIPVPELTNEAVQALLNHDWPGNVRELKNTVERAPFLSDGGPILAEHVRPPNFNGSHRLLDVQLNEQTDVRTDPRTKRTSPRRPFMDESPTLSFAKKSGPDVAQNATPESEKARVMKALELANGNQTRAAELLGISRRTLINRLDEYQLPRPRKDA